MLYDIAFVEPWGCHADKDARTGRAMSIRRAMRSKRGFGVLWLGYSKTVLDVRVAIAGIALITCLVGGLGLTIAELRRGR